MLRAAVRLAPPGMEIGVFAGVADLPLFNPDVQPPFPAPVARLYSAVAAADALLIASPEYAHGVTGTIKTLLDWLVGFEPFAYKHVAVINTSPRATLADAALRETLRTMAAQLVTPASINLPLLGVVADEAALLRSPHLAEQLSAALVALQDFVVLKSSSQSPSFPLE
jgi:NAD(P)H-dependent FMN reductase